MTIFEGLEGLQRLSPGAAVSIGNFDGIHRGHRRILDEARRLRDAPPGPLAEQFWQILREQARPAHLVEGPGFSFGKGRGGNIDRLREWCAADGVALHVIDPITVPLLDLHVVPVSSSLVRWLLVNGRARDAA